MCQYTISQQSSYYGRRPIFSNGVFIQIQSCSVPWPTRPMATWAVPSSAKAHLAKTHRTKGAGSWAADGSGTFFLRRRVDGNLSFRHPVRSHGAAAVPSYAIPTEIKHPLDPARRPAPASRRGLQQPSPLRPFDAKLNFFRAPPPPPPMAPAKAQAPSSFKPWPSNRMSKSPAVAACSATTWMTFFGDRRAAALPVQVVLAVDLKSVRIRPGR